MKDLSMIFDGFLKNLIITGCACVLPIIIGGIVLYHRSIKSKTSTFIDKLFSISDCLCPIALLTTSYYCFSSVNNRSVLAIIVFSVAFWGYIPNKAVLNLNWKINLLLLSIDLFSTVFGWSLCVKSIGIRDILWAAGTIYSRESNSTAMFIPLIISFLLLFVLWVSKQIIMSHVVAIDIDCVEGKHKQTPFLAPKQRILKSKTIASILALALGNFGVHRYYLGYKKQGFAQTLIYFSLVLAYLAAEMELLLLSAVFLIYTVVASIWVLVDFVRILTSSLTPADDSDYRENQPKQVQLIQPTSNLNISLDSIWELAKLREQNILTDEEFQQKKAEFLSKL